MPGPTTRDEFKDYCLRRLGFPVIKINLADSQIEDRIDDALQKFNEWHMDGNVETYYKHLITNTDVTREYIKLPAQIQNVMHIIPLQDKSHYVTMFDIQYQMRLNDIFDLNFAGNMSQYVQTQQFVSLMNDVLNGKDLWRHHRRSGKLYIEADWGTELVAGRYIIIHCTTTLDPDELDDDDNPVNTVWNDAWLKSYATALIKREWGEILMKFGGVQMLGGVTMSGSDILTDAKEQLDELEEELVTKFQLPIDFIVA